MRDIKAGKQGFGWLKSLALLPLPLFILLFVLFTYIDNGRVIEPPYLLLALNILFLAIIPFSIAYLAWRSYADSGQLSLFFIGCGMVAFGFGSLVAGFTINIPGGTNLTPSIHNAGALLGALLICAAAIFSLQKTARYKSGQHRTLYLGLCYLAVILLMSLFAIASYENLLPPFFVQGTGPTMLRQFVLGAATLLFAVSSIIFIRVSVRSASDFTYWLSLAMALITIGMCALFLEKSVGSPIGWVGRAAQYLGCVYLLVGMVSIYRISNIKRISLENEFARSFNYIEANYKTLVEMAPNAVISSDKHGRILTWNPAAATIFGYQAEEAIGARLQELIFPRESEMLLNSELQTLAKAGGQGAKSSNRIETIARRKQGGALSVEVSMALEKVSGEWLGTFIIRDTTEHKVIEERTLRQRAILEAINRVFEETLRCETDVEVASVCLAVAQELTGSKFGWIGEANAEGHLDTISLSDPGWASCRIPETQATKMIRNMQVRGIWGRVLIDGKSLITNDPPRHPDSVGVPEGHPGLTAFLGVPLKHAGKTIGMIALANKPNGYDLRDQEAIEALSSAFMEALRSKRSEEVILRSKLLLQSVIDSTPDWMYVKDFQHKFLLVNRSFGQAQDLTPQDMIGRADTDFFSEELCLGNPDKGIRGFHADDNQTFQGKMVHNSRNIVTWADGSMHIYDTYKIPLAEQSGRIYAALVYSRDITEQQEADYEREASFNTLQKTLHDVINTMAKIVEMRDPYTSGHQGRVAGLAGAIAKEMKLDDSRVEHLVMASSIHDVGKMYVPADILSKPGKLSNIEWEMIKTHVQGSYDILKDLEFSQPIALMVLQHHERLNGSGYPNGLKGDGMLLEAKILAVADVVEAICSHRPYRPALGLDKALEEISRNKGILYDADVVDICVKLFKEQDYKFE